MTKRRDPLDTASEATELHELTGTLDTTSGGASDPEWAKDSGALADTAASDTRGRTVPIPPFIKAKALLASAAGRVKALLSGAGGRAKVLPLGAQLGGVAGLAFLVGLLIGALALRGRAAAAPTDELGRFAARVTAPEGEIARRALVVNDPIGALLVFRTPGAYEHLRADPVAQALRARLALQVRDPADALDWFEQAFALDPKLAEEAWAGDAVIQTYVANKPARTGALLQRLPKPAAKAALLQGCVDWQYRVRHGAQDALKGLGEICPDTVGGLIADAWQLERCDQVRPVVTKLAAAASTDERVASVLDGLGRRSAIQGCIADLLPRASK